MSKKINVWLSPGHNEFTFDKNGSKGGYYKDGRFEEFNFNIDVVEKQVELLKPYSNYLNPIQLEFDNNKVDKTLLERINYINKNYESEDIIISTHANAGNIKANGQWGFFASSRGLDFLNIYSKNVKNSLIPYTKTYKCKFDDWTEFGIVLRTKPVAVLIEHGFFTNENDRKILRTEMYKNYCAKKVVDSILEYYNIKKIEDVKNKNWIELIKNTDFPDRWEKDLKNGVKMAKEFDIGYLEFLKYLPSLIEKIGNK